MAKNTKDVCIVFHEDGTCEMTRVEESSSEAIVTKSGMYEFDTMQKFMNIRGSNLIYIAGKVDLESRVEAQNLRNLRRSTALKRVFEFDVKDKTDYFKYVPYIIIAMLILFK